MQILAVSDKESFRIYSPYIRTRFNDIDLAVGCGDISYFYLEYIVSSLDIPLYFVRGNHAKNIEYGFAGQRSHPWGGIDLHRKVLRDPKTGLLLAGIEGSLRYNLGEFQYTQTQMWLMVVKMVPGLIWNRIRYGRFLDIFVTHAPPWGIHDDVDPAHVGVKAFRWLINVFQPAYHLHGHIHIYYPGIETRTVVGKTIVLNTYGFRRVIIPAI